MVTEQALREDRRALAAVLAHEIQHASQVAAGHGNRLDCVAMEVDAHRVQAVVWGTFWEGFGPRRTPLERQLSTDLRLWETQGEGGLDKRVVDQPGYQAQCDLWVP